MGSLKCTGTERRARQGRRRKEGAVPRGKRRRRKKKKRRKRRWRSPAPAPALTAGLLHPARDGGEDAAVAEHHDEQRQQEEAGEGEHVVERLLPVRREAAHRGALHEAPGPRPAHRVEDERLRGDTGPSAAFPRHCYHHHPRTRHARHLGGLVLPRNPRARPPGAGPAGR